jgi:hypothetical protein
LRRACELVEFLRMLDKLEADATTEEARIGFATIDTGNDGFSSVSS